MKHLLVALVVTVPLLGPVFAARSQDATPVQAAQVYDESADARAVLDAALVRATKENKRVLIQWGANWCGWCRTLHGVMTKNAEVSRKLLYEYEVVRVDVGRFDKNMELARSLGADFKGIPYLTILDAQRTPLAQHDTVAFEVAESNSHDPKKLVEFLTAHQAKYLDANAVREAAFELARKDGKRVFLHFGAPWCGWCHKLEGWMAQPDVRALLEKDFVDLKIDTDRMLGGAELLKSARALSGSKEGGIPWFVLCAADGKQLATSDGADGNIGFPYKDQEIAHFVGMLAAAKLRLTDAEIEVLRKSLVALREADERKKNAGR